MDVFSSLSPAAIKLLERHMMLEQLVVRELMAQAAANEQLSPQQEEQILTTLCQRYKVAEPEQLEASLKERDIEPALVMWQASLPARLQKYGENTFAAKAEARFLERKTQLDRVIYSLLRVQNADLAQELYLRIVEGEANFADLAAEFAEGPEKNTKGIIGPVPLTNAHPVLAEWLRTSRPGEVRTPLRIENWYLVVRLESYTPATLDQVTLNQMAQELFQAWAQEEAALRIGELKAQANQERHQP